jgi:hypothetical protein
MRGRRRLVSVTLKLFVRCKRLEHEKRDAPIDNPKFCQPPSFSLPAIIPQRHGLIPQMVPKGKRMQQSMEFILDQ